MVLFHQSEYNRRKHMHQMKVPSELNKRLSMQEQIHYLDETLVLPDQQKILQDQYMSEMLKIPVPPQPQPLNLEILKVMQKTSKRERLLDYLKGRGATWDSE